MSVIVPRNLQIPADADCRAGRPASSLRVGHAAASGVTHVGGHMLGGLRVCHCGENIEVAANGTRHYRIHRHPNCDHLYVAVVCLGLVTQEEPSTLTFTAGAGAAVAASRYHGGVSSQDVVVLRAPWGAADTGWTACTLVSAGVYVQSVIIYDWPRTSLDSDEHAVMIRDETYRRISLREGDPIAAGTDGSVSGTLAALQYSWDDYRQAMVSWSSLDGVTTDSGDWTNPFGALKDFAWRVRSRQRLATDTSNTALPFVYAKVSGGATYSLRCVATNDTASNDSTTKTDLTNSSGAWVELDALDVDCVTYGDLVIEGQITAGAGTITIYDVAIGEE